MAPKPQVKDDPNTFIPPAVRRAAEAADAAIRAQSGQPAPEAPLELAGVVAPEAPPPQEAQFANGGPVSAPVNTPAPEPVPEETWEHKYKSMEGRYKRAETDIRSMSEQLNSMQVLVSNLKAKQAPAELPLELRPQSFLTPEERSEYGDEFLSVVAKRAKEELSPDVAALKYEVAGLRQQLDGTREQSLARMRMDLELALDQRLPQWRDINVSQEFHSWLALPDAYSGANRHDLLRVAYEQGNTPRVYAFFKGFLDQEAALDPRAYEPRPADNGRVPLESFAAPGRAKTSAASSAPVEKPIFTHAQIARFYAESAAGKWRGREEEYNRIDRAIIEAGREGRVR
jgi:hypothetical protein